MVQFTTVNTKKLAEKSSAFLRSVWLFPALLTLALILLTAFKINGSSAGVYQTYFYGTQKDSHLLANKPQSIRSDEFLVNTQMVLAQSKAHFPEVNENIGNGENMSLILDVPYKGWSQLFKPHNLAFFALPVDYAFAFKWWLMAYLLAISCYFFVLALLPGRRLLAAGIATSLLFSAFVQWWYQYITVGPLYYSLFLGTTFVYFLRQKALLQKILLAALITYLVICFALVLYPPFQIACMIALAGFVVGELVVHYRDSGGKNFLQTLGWLAGCLAVAGTIVGLYVVTRSDVIHAINNTVYPGQRVVESGGFSVAHLLSGNLGHQFMSDTATTHYRLFNAPTNQSEASNFLLLTPFLFVPSLALLYVDKKKGRKTDWPLLGVNIVFVLFMLELFAHAFTPLSKLFFFQKIPLQRGLIGLGLLNVLQLVLFIRNLAKKRAFSRGSALFYTFLVFCVELWIGLYAHRHFPGFIGRYRMVLYALPLTFVVYLLLRKYFRLGIVIFALFSLYISFAINPFYRGLTVVEHNPLDTTVQQLNQKTPDARWAAEGIYLENFAAINGAHSLSGVYYYPQPNIWKQIGPGDQSLTYNRYAHADFHFVTEGDRNTTNLTLLGVDHYIVTTNVCSSFLKDHQVTYVLTTGLLASPCVSLVKQVGMPGQTFNIYQLKP